MVIKKTSKSSVSFIITQQIVFKSVLVKHLFIYFTRRNDVIELTRMQDWIKCFSAKCFPNKESG